MFFLKYLKSVAVFAATSIASKTILFFYMYEWISSVYRCKEKKKPFFKCASIFYEYGPGRVNKNPRILLLRESW